MRLKSRDELLSCNDGISDFDLRLLFPLHILGELRISALVTNEGETNVCAVSLVMGSCA
jgi:hypothetical protein